MTVYVKCKHEYKKIVHKLSQYFILNFFNYLNFISKKYDIYDLGFQKVLIVYYIINR